MVIIPTDIEPTRGKPQLRLEFDKESDPLGTLSRNCGWDLSWGCNVSVGHDPDTWDLVVTVNTSDRDKWLGVTQRRTTPEDLAAFAGMLLALAGKAETQWAVWYGGDDPNECAGTFVYDDRGAAEEAVQWIVGGRLATRTVHVGPWAPAEVTP